MVYHLQLLYGNWGGGGVDFRFLSSRFSGTRKIFEWESCEELISKKLYVKMCLLAMSLGKGKILKSWGTTKETLTQQKRIAIYVFMEASTS